MEVHFKFDCWSSHCWLLIPPPESTVNSVDCWLPHCDFPCALCREQWDLCGPQTFRAKHGLATSMSNKNWNRKCSPPCEAAVHFQTQRTLHFDKHVFLFFYRNYLPEENTKCIPITQLRDTIPRPTLSSKKPELFTEYFLNFHFSGRLSEKIGAFKPNINGIVHMPHDRPPQVQSWL